MAMEDWQGQRQILRSPDYADARAQQPQSRCDGRRRPHRRQGRMKRSAAEPRTDEAKRREQSKILLLLLRHLTLGRSIGVDQLGDSRVKNGTGNRALEWQLARDRRGVPRIRL